jgi:hypothetical protein
MVIGAALALASCTTTPAPSTTASRASSAPPSFQSTPAGGLVTDSVGRVSITHPVSWRLAVGPPAVAGGYVPLWYLSTVPLAIKPCPTPDATTHEFNGCPFPAPSLPVEAVVMTIEPNPGLDAMVPPNVTSEPADGACHSAGGERQILSVVGGVVVAACLKGPDLDTEEAQVRASIASITGVF